MLKINNIMMEFFGSDNFPVFGGLKVNGHL